MLVIKITQKVPEIIINKWLIVSIIEFALLILLIILYLKSNKKHKSDDYFVDEHVRKFKNTEVDFNNMFNSMFNSKELYDQMKKKIHPDRFPNDLEQNKLASKLATELNESKNDIGKLKEIKAMAEEKLGLTF